MNKDDLNKIFSKLDHNVSNKISFKPLDFICL